MELRVTRQSAVVPTKTVIFGIRANSINVLTKGVRGQADIKQ